MTEKVEYQIVYSYSDIYGFIEGLEREVQECAELGWEPVGGPFRSIDDEEAPVLAQAMIRRVSAERVD